MEGMYKEKYLQYIADAVNDQNQIVGLVENYFQENNYSNNQNWYKAHALCQLSYQIGIFDQDCQKLYCQLMDKSVMLHSSKDLNHADYEQWFGITKRLNDIFINLGIDEASEFQYNLLSTARPGFQDLELANQYLNKQ